MFIDGGEERKEGSKGDRRETGEMQLKGVRVGVFIAAVGGGNKRRIRKGDRRESDEIQLEGARVKVFIAAPGGRKGKKGRGIEGKVAKYN